MSRCVFVILMICAMVPTAIGTEAENAVSSVLPAAKDRGPGSLTTIFASNGGYAGNMFDIEMLVSINEITAIDINVDPVGYTTEVDVWWREGTCVGHDQDPTGWHLLGHGTGIAAGYDLPTFIDLSGNGFSFDAGKLYGFYVDITSYPQPGINYSNGGPNIYANSEMSLTTYYGKGVGSFPGSTFFPRIWNGTVYYEAGPPDPLRVYPESVSTWYGGQAEFYLFGGPNLGGRGYCLFSTFSGPYPGTPLPGGETLPINWDWFTEMVLSLAMTGNPLVDGFFDHFDADGYGRAMLTVPGHLPLYNDWPVHFAWCTYNPFDFVSNHVMLIFIGKPNNPAQYFYDDGTSENALGWTAGGESVWAHLWDSGTGDTVTSVHSTFGASNSSLGPPDGDPCWVYVWDDPNNDGDPVDGVLIGEGSGVIANTNTNTFSQYILDAPTPVTGKFFTACHCWQDVGVYAAPMDETTPYSGGVAWFMGGAIFDKNDLTTTAAYEMGSIGFPAYWLLRVDND